MSKTQVMKADCESEGFNKYWEMVNDQQIIEKQSC